MFEEVSRFNWNRIPEETNISFPDSTVYPAQETEYLQILSPPGGKKRKRLKRQCVDLLKNGASLTLEEITLKMGYHKSSSSVIEHLLSGMTSVILDSGRYRLRRSSDPPYPAATVTVDSDTAKVIGVINCLDELTLFEKVIQVAGVPDSFNDEKLRYHYNIKIIINDDRKFAGTKNLIDKKIAAVTNILDQTQPMNMDEIKSLFYPLPISEYIKPVCEELIETSEGFISRKAIIKKFANVMSRYGELTRVDKVIQEINLNGQINWKKAVSNDFIFVKNGEYEYVGNQGIIDKKINNIKVSMNRGKPMTMDEINALFHPLPVSDKYISMMCEKLVQVPEGYVSQKAIQSIKQKSTNIVISFIRKNGFASATEINQYLKKEYGFDVPIPNLTYGVEIVLCKDDLWYISSDTSKPLSFCGNVTREEVGLPVRPPIKSCQPFIYLSNHTALLSEAARMLKTSVPKLKKMIQDNVLETIIYNKTVRIPIENLLANGALPYEKSGKEIEADAEIINSYPVTRTNLNLSPVKRGVKGRLSERVVSFPEAASLLALERDEVQKAISRNILSPVENTDCLSATEVFNLLKNRKPLNQILDERLVTTFEVTQMLGVSRSFTYNMDHVIKKRGQNNYGMNLYKRGDVLKYVDKVEELILEVYRVNHPRLKSKACRATHRPPI